MLADQRAVIDMRDAEIAKLKDRIQALEAAVVEKFGAHGVLVCQYSDPRLSAEDRRKADTAAIAFEKAKVSAPQEHAHFHLFGHLEAARLAKRQANAKTIEAQPSPAA